eukprot:764155-Hanusia_phi.AAC.1
MLHTHRIHWGQLGSDCILFSVQGGAVRTEIRKEVRLLYQPSFVVELKVCPGVQFPFTNQVKWHSEGASFTIHPKSSRA